MPKSREAQSKTEVRESLFRNSAAPAVIAGPLVESWPVDFSEATFHRYAGFLCDRRLSHPAKASLKASVLKQQRRSYGNQYVQRLVKQVMRSKAAASVAPASLKNSVR